MQSPIEVASRCPRRRTRKEEQFPKAVSSRAALPQQSHTLGKLPINAITLWPQRTSIISLRAWQVSDFLGDLAVGA